MTDDLCALLTRLGRHQRSTTYKAECAVCAKLWPCDMAQARDALAGWDALARDMLAAITFAALHGLTDERQIHLWGSTRAFHKRLRVLRGDPEPPRNPDSPEALQQRLDALPDADGADR